MIKYYRCEHPGGGFLAKTDGERNYYWMGATWIPNDPKNAPETLTKEYGWNVVQISEAEARLLTFSQENVLCLPGKTQEGVSLSQIMGLEILLAGEI